MQSWIYFAIIAQSIWAITSLIDKFVISKGHIKNPLVYIVLNGLMNVLLIFLLPFVSFAPLKLADFFVVLFSGIMLSAAVVIYYKAVQYEEISKIKIMFQLEPIMVLIFAFLLLGEALTKNHFVGFLFLICAGIIVSYKKINGSFRLGKAIYLVIISIIFSAIATVAAKYVYSIMGFWIAFLWLRLTNMVALAVLLAPSIRKEFIQTFKTMNAKVRGILFFKMIIDFSAFVFAGYALMSGPASLVVAVEKSAAPLLIFMLALLTSIYLPSFVKEEISKSAILTKLLAIALIIAGIWFINL